MSNKILIKHGENTPVKGQLDGYELGYSTKEEIIYFNNNKEIIPISAGYAIKKVDNLPLVADAEDRVIYMVPSVGDNNELTYNVSSFQPEDTSKLWIDTSSDYPLLKFYDTSNGTWKNIVSVWT